MPRAARLDVPGLLQHVIVRGIEKRDIFLDDQDRRSFLRRFSKLLQKNESDCFAWALLPNHAHLLLRPKRTKLALIMRRLLTGYAVTFNLRHQRSGHLFQNRYKSIVCEKEPYLLELVRYIHLNPLRAGLVKNMNELDQYTWSGHAVLMGNRKLLGQNTDEVLTRFGPRIAVSRRRYRNFVKDGISQGKREELVGGGLWRTLKLTGYEEVRAYDERILGSGEFVEGLRKENELSDRMPVAMPLKELIEQIATFLGIRPEVLRQRTRGKRLVDARSVISYVAVREMGHNGAQVARALNMSRSGVSIAAGRGEGILRNNQSLRNKVNRLTI
ncbi:MAG: transposase [Thermodesulfobacteriota bacterium]